MLLLHHADHLKRTPLHWAAEMGRLDAAVALLDYGCDVDAVDCNGRCVVSFTLLPGWCECTLHAVPKGALASPSNDGLVNRTLCE